MKNETLVIVTALLVVAGVGFMVYDHRKKTTTPAPTPTPPPLATPPVTQNTGVLDWLTWGLDVYKTATKK